MQGKLQAKELKYDRWYMHFGKVHCIRLPEFLISLLDTVGLTFFLQCYYNPHFYASKNGTSALRAKFSHPFPANGWTMLFFLCRTQRSQGGEILPRAGCSQHRALVQLVTGWEGNWSFIHTLKTGGNDPKFLVVFVTAIYFLFLNCGCFQIFY